MVGSKRLDLLGKGVFARNDLRKQKYKSSRYKNKTLPLIDLSLGSTDLLPPSVVLQAINQSLLKPDSSSYCLHAATRPFREAVTAWSEKRFGVRVDPDKEVLLLVGSQEGTAHLPLALMNPGDSGLILDPSYPSHKGGLVLADAHIERLLIKPDDGWKPDFSSLTKTQWDQLKMMVFGYPHNPTAVVGSQSWLQEAMDFGVNHQVVIAHDNPYVDLALEGDAPALLLCDGWKECGIEFFSFSKAWSMGGFRLAFAIGAEPLVTALRNIKSVVDFNQSLALQSGAIAALSKAIDWPNNVIEIYKDRRDRAIDLLENIGWKVPVPSMAFYLWMPIPSWAKSRGWGDESLSSKLLKDTGVSLTPGSGFGVGGEGWLRLALVRPVDELEEAIARIASWWNAHS